MENSLILSEKEKKVLTSLYKLGESSVWEIAKDNMLNRTTVYPVLEKLIEKGLVSKIGTDNKDFFQTIKKEDLEIWIRQRKEKIENESRQLLEMAKKPSKKTSLISEVNYFEGLEGVKNLYADSWRNNEEKIIYCITDYKSAYETMGEFFEKEYFPARIRHGVKIRNLIPESEKGRKELKTANTLLREMKFIKLFKDLEIEINIYEEKVSIVAFDKNKPSGVIIKNERIANALKEIFGYLWKTTK